MRILFALLSVGIGAALLMSGYRLARFIIPLMGLLVGLAFGGAIASDIAGTVFLGTLLSVTIGLITGLVLALLAYMYYSLAVVVMAAGLGYWAGSGFVLLFGFSPGILSVIVGITVGIAVGIIAVVTNAPKFVLIALTSVAGAVASIGGIMLLFNQIPLDTFSYTTARVAITNSFLWGFTAFFLAVIGIAVQAGSTQGYEFDEWSATDDYTHHITPTTTPHGGAVH